MSTRINQRESNMVTKKFSTSYVACLVILCSVPVAAQAQQAPAQKAAPGQKADRELGDRITPVVRVVQKCQGSVVAFISPQTGNAMGTGVIVHEQGYIVTNGHVVGKTKQWKIQLIDKTEHVADVLKVAQGDLALLKITSSKKVDFLPPAPSDKVFLGETVIAIGHPYGYSYSIGTGILSATGLNCAAEWGRDQGRYPNRRRHQPRQLRRTAHEYRW